MLGVYALPIGLCDTVDAVYAPAQHIFYGSRIIDSSDKLPKYKELPDSERMD